MTLDRVALNLNVNGKPIDYIDEADWGKPFEQIVSPFCSKVYQFIQIDRRMLPLIKQQLAPVGYSKILGPMGEPIQPGRGQERVPKEGRPFGRGAIAGEQDAAPLVPLIDHIIEIFGGWGRERFQPKVVQDEQVRP